MKDGQFIRKIVELRGRLTTNWIFMEEIRKQQVTGPLNLKSAAC